MSQANLIDAQRTEIQRLRAELDTYRGRGVLDEVNRQIDARLEVALEQARGVIGPLREENDELRRAVADLSGQVAQLSLYRRLGTPDWDTLCHCEENERFHSTFSDIRGTRAGNKADGGTAAELMALRNQVAHLTAENRATAAELARAQQYALLMEQAVQGITTAQQ